MAYTLANGSILRIASAYGPPLAMSTVSNAASATATLPADHGLAPGNYVEITSGWSRISNRIARIGKVTGAEVELLKVDTQRVNIFAPGGGGGTLRVITAWEEIQQVLSVSTSGGEQQYTTFQPLDSDTEVRMPTTRSAYGIQFTLADDPDMPGQKAVAAASEDRLPRAIRLDLSNGGVLLYNGTCALSKTPTLESNELMKITLDASLLTEPVRY